jgi:DNA ligase 1
MELVQEDGGMARFVELASLAERLAGEASKLKKRAAIAEAIRLVHDEANHSNDAANNNDNDSNNNNEAGWFSLYLAGMPFAEADGRRLNAGGALLSKALLAVSGASEVSLREAYRRFGDLGAAGFCLMQGASGGLILTLAEVAEIFAAMAVARSTAVRLGLVEEMLRRASALEVKYLLKLMLGDMRIGVKQSLVEEAIAEAASVPVAGVRNAVMLEADLAGAVRRAFAGTLGEARMRLFHPLGFMLASPVESPEEAVERFSGNSKATANANAGPSTTAAKSAAFAQDDNSLEGGAFAQDDNSLEGVEENRRRQGRDAGPSTTLRFAQDDNSLESAAFARDDNSVEQDGRADNDKSRSLRDDKQTIQAYLEDKYDGIRAQVHCGDAGQAGRVAIYSRSREDVTASFPELEEAFAGVTGDLGGPLIFDGEILGWDLAAERALPFAVLGQRIGRKRVSNEMRQAVPVVFMAFDLMCAGGELLLERPLRERRNRLEAVVEGLVETVRSPVMVAEGMRTSKKRKGSEPGQGELFGGVDEAGAGGLLPTLGDEASKDGAPGRLGPGGDGEAVPRLMISPSRLVESAEDIERAYADARARANEGVMLKAAESEYQPGRRGLAWVKLKRELATLDVVVTGAEFGHGRRAGILSDYTFAVRGENGELLNVGKAYSGLTDVEIAAMSAWMMEHTLEDGGHFRTVEPLMVLEVAFNNIMRSERHASGFAMRFPRIVRIRTDKPVAEIDTLARVEEVYLSQVDRPVE